jgi:hypothetical protein
MPIMSYDTRRIPLNNHDYIMILNDPVLYVIAVKCVIQTFISVLYSDTLFTINASCL